MSRTGYSPIYRASGSGSARAPQGAFQLTGIGPLTLINGDLTVIPLDASDGSALSFDDFGLRTTSDIVDPVFGLTVPAGYGFQIDSSHEGLWKLGGTSNWSGAGSGSVALTVIVGAGAYADDYDFAASIPDPWAYDDMSGGVYPFFANLVDGDLVYMIISASWGEGSMVAFDFLLSGEYWGAAAAEPS